MRAPRPRDARAGLARAILCLALVGLAPGCTWTRAALYDPEPDAERVGPPAPVAGEAPLEDLWLVSADGTRLHARLARFPGATRALLLCHGTGGNVARYTALVRELRDRTRAHVLCFDYRGYGRSEGEPDEPGLEADARAALDALDAATGLPAARTVLVGHSLGGAVAIDLAWHREGLAGLAVLSSFTSIEDMCRHLTLMGQLADLCPDRWESLAKVKTIACPKLFLHGALDSFVPCRQGERLFAAAPEPKRLVVVEDSGHEMWEHDQTVREIADFVAAVAPEPTGAPAVAVELVPERTR